MNVHLWRTREYFYNCISCTSHPPRVFSPLALGEDVGEYMQECTPEADTRLSLVHQSYVDISFAQI